MLGLRSTVPGVTPAQDAARRPAARSRLGLDATNFFLAQVTGITTPFLADLLRERQWGYEAIGRAASVSAFGVLLVQMPAALVAERLRRPRVLAAVASLVVGACYALVPLVPGGEHAIDSLLFVAGAGQAFFAPALAALALGLVGHRRLGRTLGANQAWNHAGNIAAAFAAMALVDSAGVSSIFYSIGLVGLLAAGSALLIAREDVDAGLSVGGGERRLPLRELLRDRRAAVLVATAALFHFAAAPLLPFAALRVKDLGGTDRDVAALVVTAQAAMIPVALVTGRLCERWGRKPVLAIGFASSPVCLLACAFVDEPGALVALQALSGVALGAFGVVSIAMCADITRGTGRFNALVGVLDLALALAAVAGPLVTGHLEARGGFGLAFVALAAIGSLAAAVFVLAMPETDASRAATPRRRGSPA